MSFGLIGMGRRNAESAMNGFERVAQMESARNEQHKNMTHQAALQKAANKTQMLGMGAGMGAVAGLSSAAMGAKFGMMAGPVGMLAGAGVGFLASRLF